MNSVGFYSNLIGQFGRLTYLKYLYTLIGIKVLYLIWYKEGAWI